MIMQWGGFIYNICMLNTGWRHDIRAALLFLVKHRCVVGVKDKPLPLSYFYGYFDIQERFEQQLPVISCPWGAE